MAQNKYNNPKNPKQEEGIKMKKKALILVLVCAMAIMGLGVGKASAALTWYTCTVVAGGPSGTTINPANPPNTLIRLTENAQLFSNKWFKLPDDRAKEMLATALTAMASDISVTISTDGTGTYPYIQAIYLVKVPQ